MKKKFFLMSLMITFIVITLSLSVGSVFIPIKSLLFLSPMDEYTKTIIFDLRLPRILMAFLVGMLLASSGNIVQIIFQNPLADPYIHNRYCFKCNLWCCYSLSFKVARIFLWNSCFYLLYGKYTSNF